VQWIVVSRIRISKNWSPLDKRITSLNDGIGGIIDERIIDDGSIDDGIIHDAAASIYNHRRARTRLPFLKHLPCKTKYIYRRSAIYVRHRSTSAVDVYLRRQSLPCRRQPIGINSPDSGIDSLTYNNYPAWVF
jgi:hypothetical protein